GPSEPVPPGPVPRTMHAFPAHRSLALTDRQPPPTMARREGPPMTESDWDSCTEPARMLAFLRPPGKLSERKARLFPVACCRRIWPLWKDERSRRAVEVAEAFADDPGRAEDLAVAMYAANFACNDTDPTDECDLAEDVARIREYYDHLRRVSKRMLLLLVAML